MNLSTVTQLFSHFGYWIIFPISIIEGPIITIISGFLVSLKLFNLYIIFFVLVIGDLAGDTLYYLLGRYGGQWFLKYFGKRIGATPERILFIEKHFNKHDWKFFLFGKTHAIGSLLLFVAGVIKIKYFRFILYNTIGTIPKTILFLAIGFYFGETYSASAKYLNYFSLIWLSLSLILIIGYIDLKKYLQKTAFKDKI